MRITLILTSLLLLFPHLAVAQEPIEIHDLEPRLEIMQLGRGTVEDIAWHPDGQMIAVGGSQGIYLYNPAFTLLQHIDMPNVTLLAWHPDGTRLTSAHADGSVLDWTITREMSGFEIEQKTLKQPGISITVLSWEPMPDQVNVPLYWLYVGLSDSTLQRMDGHDLLQDSGYGTGETVTGITGTGSYVVISDNSQVKAYLYEQIPSASYSDIPAVTTGGGVLALTYVANQSLIAAGQEDIQIISFQNWERLESIATLTGHTSRINDLAWSPDGTMLASVSGFNFQGSELRLWDGTTFAPISVFPGTAALHSVEWRPGTMHVTAAGEDNIVRTFDTVSGQVIATSQGHIDAIEALAWSPDGTELASASDDGIIRLWSTPEGIPIAQLQGHTSGVNAVAWSPDGLMLASGGWDDTVRIWMRNSGKQRFVFTGHSDRVWMVAWHPTQPILASASRDGTVRTWDVYSGQPLQVYETHTYVDLESVVWSADGTQLAATGDDGLVRIWNVESAELVHLLEGHGRQVWTVAWEPGGGDLITGGYYDGSMRVWNTETGEQRSMMLSTDVIAMAWSPGGTYLISGHENGTLRVWDVESGATWRVLSAHKSSVYALAWHPTGTWLASGDSEGIIRIWSG